jgi:hypothetical protein
MLLPRCHVLIASAEDNWRDSVCRRSRRPRRRTKTITGAAISFTAVATREELLDRVASDGLLQCVVLDFVGTRDSLGAAKAELRRLRSELDIFLAVPAGEAVDDNRAELLDRKTPGPAYCCGVCAVRSPAARARRLPTRCATTSRAPGMPGTRRDIPAATACARAPGWRTFTA